MRRLAKVVVAMVAALLAAQPVPADIIINEFVYDDGGADDREFVELFNSGLSAVDISGWALGGQDNSGANPPTQRAVITIPGAIGSGTTMVGAGGFYVIGQSGVPNVNLVRPSAFLENDAETLELRSGATLVDAVVYESNKGPTPAAPNQAIGYGVLPAAVATQMGPGIWDNHQSADVGSSPSAITTSTLGRFVDGHDTNNNGRDFGMLKATPGATNHPLPITSFAPPDPAGQAVGTTYSAEFAYSFVAPRVIDPTVADAINPNAIAAPPVGGNRAIILWDPSGGGDGASSRQTFTTSQSSFNIMAYLDTRNTPIQSSATGTPFTGSEVTVYGIGGSAGTNGLTDISGKVGLPDTMNGTTGVAWVYEKVGESSAGAGNVSEKLYLVNAGDGGDAGLGGDRPFDWTILATIDLSTTAPGWHNLAIRIDAAGNGVGLYDSQQFLFTTALTSGVFNVAYRENMQVGSDATPDSLLRPATFTVVPEPAAIVLSAIGFVLVAASRRSRMARSEVWRRARAVLRHGPPRSGESA